MSILSPEDRQKRDSRDDSAFYDQPRFVTHADDGFCRRLTELYDTHLDRGDTVFDAMSSWVSHLPDTEFERVVGHGLNGEELAENDRLDDWFLQSFNDEQSLPLAEESVDAVLCALSVQYLQYPEAVFESFRDVLTPDGVVIVSFSNRMFPTKAVRAWRERSMAERLELVEAYVEQSGATVVETITERPSNDPFFAVVGRA